LLPYFFLYILLDFSCYGLVPPNAHYKGIFE
jgi:hypothetical protein